MEINIKNLKTTMKKKIGTVFLFLMFLFAIHLTIRLSGHKESLGILVMGLISTDIIVVVVGILLTMFKLTNHKSLLLFVILIFISFFSFLIYHQSYNSYRETRSVFWGYNGEKDTVNIDR